MVINTVGKKKAGKGIVSVWGRCAVWNRMVREGVTENWGVGHLGKNLKKVKYQLCRQYEGTASAKAPSRTLVVLKNSRVASVAKAKNGGRGWGLGASRQVRNCRQFWRLFLWEAKPVEAARGFEQESDMIWLNFKRIPLTAALGIV